METVAVGFDFDHTLGVDNKLERDAFVRIIEGYVGSPIHRRPPAAAGLQTRSVDEAAGTAFEQRLTDYRAGHSSLAVAFSKAFETAIGRPAPPGAFDAFRDAAVSMVAEYVRPLPGARKLLSALDASAVPYAILTNGWNPLQQCKAKSIAFARPVFVSDDLGVRKPNIHAFNVLRDYFDLQPAGIWYVGDDPLVDIVGALGAGMRAVWVDWERRAYPTNVPAPTAIVTDLADILSIIM